MIAVVMNACVNCVDLTLHNPGGGNALELKLDDRGYEIRKRKAFGIGGTMNKPEKKLTFNRLVNSIRQIHDQRTAQAGKAVNISQLSWYDRTSP